MDAPRSHDYDRKRVASPRGDGEFPSKRRETVFREDRRDFNNTRRGGYGQNYGAGGYGGRGRSNNYDRTDTRRNPVQGRSEDPQDRWQGESVPYERNNDRNHDRNIERNNERNNDRPTPYSNTERPFERNNNREGGYVERAPRGRWVRGGGNQRPPPRDTTFDYIIPKSDRYFEHDDREDSRRPSRGGRRNSNNYRRAEDRAWSHDKFEEASDKDKPAEAQNDRKFSSDATNNNNEEDETNNPPTPTTTTANTETIYHEHHEQSESDEGDISDGKEL